MKHTIKLLAIIAWSWCSHAAFAQGPPITADKPIMLSAKTVVVTTLTEIRKAEEGTFVRAPLMIHYLPTSNSLVAVHIPLVTYDYEDTGVTGKRLGDVQLMAKYQLFRLDRKAKTLRVVAKTLQTFPTSERDLHIHEMAQGHYQGYYGAVMGYETIKYGISFEAGFNSVKDYEDDEARIKLGFGLPLLRPVYPVNQLNLYFEYQSSWFTERDDYALFYAQGIQYARGRFTFDASVQVPLVQNTFPFRERRKYSLYLGTRVVF